MDPEYLDPEYPPNLTPADEDETQRTNPPQDFPGG
jgi:hypothetical protein